MGWSVQIAPGSACRLPQHRDYPSHPRDGARKYRCRIRGLYRQLANRRNVLANGLPLGTWINNGPKIVTSLVFQKNEHRRLRPASRALAVGVRGRHLRSSVLFGNLRRPTNDSSESDRQACRLASWRTRAGRDPMRSAPGEADSCTFIAGSVFTNTT
jgi:hypothetical protein